MLWIFYMIYLILISAENNQEYSLVVYDEDLFNDYNKSIL